MEGTPSREEFDTGLGKIRHEIKSRLVPHGFYGHVDNRYDPHHGYHGPMPERGAQPFSHFHGNEARDGQGHIGNAGHDAGGERSAGFAGGGHPGGGGHR